MNRLLRNRVFQTVLASSMLCILAYVGITGYQRWVYVQQVYAEAAYFGYTPDRFVAIKEQCGNGRILFLPPTQCYLYIYFTTEMTRDQLIETMIQRYGDRDVTLSGESIPIRRIAFDLASASQTTLTINGIDRPFPGLDLPSAEEWSIIRPRSLSILYWPLNPDLEYAFNGTPVHSTILGVGVRRDE